MGHEKVVEKVSDIKNQFVKFDEDLRLLHEENTCFLQDIYSLFEEKSHLQKEKENVIDDLFIVAIDIFHKDME